MVVLNGVVPGSGPKQPRLRLPPLLPRHEEKQPPNEWVAHGFALMAPVHRLVGPVMANQTFRPYIDIINNNAETLMVMTIVSFPDPEHVQRPSEPLLCLALDP